VQFPEPNVVTVAYDGLRWIHIGGATLQAPPAATYFRANSVFADMTRRLERAGASWSNVVRTWLYLGGITEREAGTERYRELNRARTDFFAEQEAAGRMAVRRGRFTFYPASTGIGTAGSGLAASCLALQTLRDDIRLQPLENPQQTSAFDYAASYSAQSPKFSRAMAVVIGDYVTTWVSGTASIVNSESVFAGDVERQTEQSIDNIQALIGPENFARHGLAGGGAKLQDLAKIRVYVKHAEDFEKCRAICERRFGPLPAIYAQADVCRPELLVEIEGVAFSRLSPSAAFSPGEA
jgi:enamine deaminase RidA (YjgF/YER057c/UK114 family)